MWHELKTDAIVASLKQPCAVPADAIFCDSHFGVASHCDPWAPTLGQDPWNEAVGSNPIFDPRYRFQNQLKSTVFKVFCKGIGVNEVSWSPADRILIGGLTELYRTVEGKCSVGAETLSFSECDPMGYFFPAADTDILSETSRLRERLVRVERELFDMRNQVSRLFAQATTPLAPARIVTGAAHDPAAAWRIAVERDGTTSPVSNLEEIYE
jgi:hypothetical protein